MQQWQAGQTLHLYNNLQAYCVTSTTLSRGGNAESQCYSCGCIDIIKFTFFSLCSHYSHWFIFYIYEDTLLHSPAATADHMTKNIPTAILFREEGSRPRRFSMGSTTLSLRGISRRMSTASNIVSQAAGRRNNIWRIQKRKNCENGVQSNKGWNLQRMCIPTQSAKCL